MHGNVQKEIVASRCIDNRFRIESLTPQLELNREVARDSHPLTADPSWMLSMLCFPPEV